MKAQGIRWLRCAAIVLLPVVTLLALTLPAAWALDQTNDARAGSSGGGEVAGNRIGVYVTSLRDFDTVGDSFGIDFWVWSIYRPGSNPLDGVEFVNAEQIETRLDQTARRGDLEWSRLKARAIVLHDWNVSNYPFDRQVLTMDLGIAAADTRVYGVDRAASGHGRNIAPDGWRVTGFDVERRTVESATDFGDPASSNDSTQEHVFVSVVLERDSVIGFFKLVAGVYAAIAIGLLSFLMTTEHATVFSGRMGVLVGALFATVVNLTVSNSVLGSPDGVSLVDKIHIVAMAYILGAAIMAVILRPSYESGDRKRARRYDLISLCVFGVSFAVINLILILQAAVSG